MLVFKRLFLFAVLLLSISSLFGEVHAITLSDYDCNIYGPVSEDGYKNGVITAFQEGSENKETGLFEERELLFFTDKDLKLVMNHLKQYCCIDLSAKEGCVEESPGPHYYASSPMIGDHLMSIGFRKLDGIEDACDTLGHDCNNRQLVPDLSVERRNKITEIAEDREGYPPAQIEEYFHIYRGDNNAIDAAMVAKQNKERGSVNTLRAQYELMCEEIAYIRKKMPKGNVAKYIEATGGIGIEAFCKNKSRDRYKQEAQYVRTLMVEKGVSYLVQNLRAYSMDYFIDNRFNDLADKYTSLEGCFSSVLSYSTNTACCNE